MDIFTMGAISLLRQIWNKILSQQEISANATSPSGDELEALGIMAILSVALVVGGK